MRTCGDCTLCCHSLGVSELEKPAQQWCKYCNIGIGCKIYESRPQSCREFSCLWLSYPQTPEAMKPRISGVVCWVTNDGEHAIALTRKHDPTAWRKPAVLDTLRLLASQGIVVVAFSGARAWIVGPTSEEELPNDAIDRSAYGVNRITIEGDVRRRVGLKRKGGIGKLAMPAAIPPQQ